MRISRRGFLTAVCGASAASLGAVPCASAASAPYVSSAWLGMLTDLSLCIGCRKCEWACNKANGFPHESLKAYEDQSVFDTVRRTEAEQYTVVNRFEPDETGKPVFVKKQCMHCIEPACASACLVKAFRKSEEGPVLYNKDVCIGCRYCMIACPFNIPAYEYSDPFTPEVRKCTMCHARFTDEGELPACAKICPEEAITFGPRADLIKLARAKIQSQPEKYVDHIYGEHEAGGTNWLYVSATPFGELGFNMDVGDKPYPEYTKGFMSTVPMVMATWPMALMGAYTFSKARKEEHASSAQDSERGSGS